ncbi:hypothetical protein C2G38_2059909 [Gigaspora rosea]|uniref:Uncharacterized protein n=1 Tax=Gigaspora rosea TaxID=44941 RepID=A0A397W7F7_9GLOM|nr:hypothetical protein C2G38_2059909 [Gigaspora rosea]
MSKFQTKKFFSIMLFVMLFFVLTKAVRKRKEGSIGQGQFCNNEFDDYKCVTSICRIKGEDTHKCQVSDERDIGDHCIIGDACKNGECHGGLCTINPTMTVASPATT